MSPLQSPNHCAWDWDAILSIWAASPGRERRQESAVSLAFDFGSIQNTAPAIGFVVALVLVVPPDPLWLLPAVASGVLTVDGAVTVPSLQAAANNSSADAVRSPRR